jgi:hypothetical protein
MSQAAQQATLVKSVQTRVFIFEVEHSLSPLTTLSLSCVSLQHPIFQRHGRVGFTETTISESSCMAPQLMFRQQRFTSLASHISVIS